jgi:WD40 repeat protein
MVGACLLFVLGLAFGIGNKAAARFSQPPELDKAIEGHKDGIARVAFSPNGKLLASGSIHSTDLDGKSLDTTVRLWDVETCKQKTVIQLQELTVFSLAFTPDSTMLAIGDGASSLTLWDVKKGQLVKKFPMGKHAVRCVAISPDGRHLVAAGLKIITIWSLKDLAKVAEFPKDGILIESIAIGGKSDLIAFAGKTFDVCVLDMKTGKTLQHYQHNNAVNALAFCGNDLLASASSDGSVILCDVALEKQRHRLRGHTAEVTSVAFSNDGKLLASGSANGQIRLWNVVSGKEEAAFTGDNSAVFSVTFSPNGKHLASGGLENKVKLWKIAK